MLLNLSNHPFDKWTENQTYNAILAYGSVEDLSFPNIDPNWDRHDVAQLVEEYIVKIRKIDPKAVHVMGELVFTHLLVNKLKDIGIPCIASTTERIVEMEGDVKKIKFNFVKFRSY